MASGRYVQVWMQVDEAQEEMGQRNLEEMFSDFVTFSFASMVWVVVEWCVYYIQFHMVGPHKALSSPQEMPHWWYP